MIYPEPGISMGSGTQTEKEKKGVLRNFEKFGPPNNCAINLSFENLCLI